MSASRRRQIIEGLKARLETTMYAVHLNEAPAFGPDDPKTAIVMVIGQDVVRQHPEHCYIMLPVSVQAIAAADLAEPWLAVEDVLAAIKQAIETTDRHLGGLVVGDGIVRGSTRTMLREPGSTFVGVAIEYGCPHVEAWGQP